MPRFKWNDPVRGRQISNYINYMCTWHPEIAREVVEHGIGDLGSWFSGGGLWRITPKTKCGCLIGTTALVVMKKYPVTCQKAIAGMNKNHDSGQGAVVLFNFIRAKQGKSILSEDEIDELPEKERRLYTCIEKAGLAAADEADLDLFNNNHKDRGQVVIDHIENSIRRKLGIKK